MAKYRLIEEIVALSQAKIWDLAKLEWILEDVFKGDEQESCLCGHFPIIEICILRNMYNENEATVGNCCVKKFIGLPSDKIFQAVKRVQSDINKYFNAESIDHAFEKGWINNWERDFYFNNIRKRNLSQKQNSKKIEINMKILSKITKSRKV